MSKARDEYIEDALAEFCVDMDEKCEYLTFIPGIRYKKCQTTMDNVTTE